MFFTWTHATLKDGSSENDAHMTWSEAGHVSTTAFAVHKCLDGVKLPISRHTRASWFRLPTSSSNMLEPDVILNRPFRPRRFSDKTFKRPPLRAGLVENKHDTYKLSANWLSCTYTCSVSSQRFINQKDAILSASTPDLCNYILASFLSLNSPPPP